MTNKKNSITQNDFIINNKLESYHQDDIPNIILPDFQRGMSDGFSIKSSDGIYYTFQCQDIAFFEANGKNTIIHFTDGSTQILNRKGIGTVQKIISAHPFFVRSHKSYVVNLNKIYWYDPEFKRIAIRTEKKERKLDIGGEYKSEFEKQFFTQKTLLNPTSTQLTKNNTNKEMPVTALLQMAYLYYNAYSDVMKKAI